MSIGDASHAAGIEAIADFMAFITARDGVIAIVPGTGGDRAACAGSPLHPRQPLQSTRRANCSTSASSTAKRSGRSPRWRRWQPRKDLFELSEGASDDDYNAYNYMVLTARAKPHARAQVPAVIHADGTARLQIVRENTDPVTHAYLKALGRRNGVEVAVNTSFNVGGPIAQTPVQAHRDAAPRKGHGRRLHVLRGRPRCRGLD